MITNKLETRSPSPQVAVDIFKDHWASDISEVLPNIKAGTAPLFGQDGRPRVAAQQLGSNGSLKGMRVLELGPLEAAHTYQLEKLGAASVLAIEANVEAYLKCLIVKELLSMQAKFLHGDFVKWLEVCQDTGGMQWDLVFCSGVLYHMTDPLRLIQLIASVTDKCFVWTHYYRDGVASRQPRPGSAGGFEATYWSQDYGASTNLGTFWGGNSSSAAWMSQEDILKAFRFFGFQDFQVDFDEPLHPAGPAFAFSARKQSANEQRGAIG